MSQKKLRITILILLSSGALFLFLLGYLNFAIFQLRKDKLASEVGKVGSECFFAIPYNSEGLYDFVFELTFNSPQPVSKDLLKTRLSQIFGNYSIAGDSISQALRRKDIEANIKWSVTVPRFELRTDTLTTYLIKAGADPNTDLMLFGDPVIGPGALKYTFYKIDQNHYCQINLYLEVTNSFAILSGQMVTVFMIDLILIFLFACALAYTIRTLRQQKRLADLQTDFINGVTHEFNTPLSSIQLAGQTLLKLEDNQVIAKKQEIATLILRQQNHLKKMVDQVLTVAVSENPFASPDIDWVPVPDRLVMIVNEWHQSQSNIQIEYKPLVIERKWIRIDPSLIVIVLHNILDNAVKYNGSDHPRIIVSSTVQGDHFTLGLKDNGMGIPAHEIREVGKKFVRGSSVRQKKIKGLGLGLYLVKLIMELHHGRVQIKSEPGLGTEILISFPCKNERAL